MFNFEDANEHDRIIYIIRTIATMRKIKFSNALFLICSIALTGIKGAIKSQ